MQKQTKFKRVSKTIIEKSKEEEIEEMVPDIELDEEFSLMLIMSRENEKLNISRFSFKYREYRQITAYDTSITLIEGSVDPKRKKDSTANEEDVGANEKKIVVQLPTIVKNQFNFSDLSTQTENCHPRNQLMQTEPPVTATFSANSSQGIIFDAYIKNTKGRKFENNCYSTFLHPRVNKLAKITERMLFQNSYDRIMQDFKYYEDPIDEFGHQIGSLLPLWKFTSEKTKFLSVTSLCWNPRYPDLFAASFGSSSYIKNGDGAIFVYSLINPSKPVFPIMTNCGVTSIDINQQFPYYICAGLDDGSVAVYNLSPHNKEPEQRSEKGVHHTHISQVQWDKGVDEGLCFYSISSDGLIVKWTLLKHGLKYGVLITLGFSESVKGYTEDLTVFGSGITLDFHTINKNLYLVGTEMGQVHLCLIGHTDQPMQTFNAHYLSVYKIAWNMFHPNIFITCSDDWTVKIWENRRRIRNPLFEFDLGSPVYGVDWAPFSSTVFAAVTANGEVFVYDLTIDKQNPVCEQVVVMLKNTRVLCLTFNRQNPVILVGDDKGAVTCLKMSPNLRKVSKKSPNPRDKQKFKQFEISKLDDVLATVR